MRRQEEKLKRLSQVLYRHEWNTVAEWANNINQLCDLTDSEITKLEHLAHPEVYEHDRTHFASATAAADNSGRFSQTLVRGRTTAPRSRSGRAKAQASKAGRVSDT